jgi:DNA-binding response OmpR family regulator
MPGLPLLVVEDDPEINQLVSRTLRREGFDVIAVFDGKEALRRLAAERFQLVVLDLMVPVVDGWELLRRIRADGEVPVLIVSARNRETDKIMGLGLGADDYLTKPFGVGELAARVKAQLRRARVNDPDSREAGCVTRGDLALDARSREVTVRGKPACLTAKEFDILGLFMANPRRVFTKEQIFSAVWGEAYRGEENTVMVHIRRLREKIEEDPSRPRRILTVWGIGYKLADE